MANKLRWSGRFANREVNVINGIIPLNASAAVGTVVGRGFTAAKTATGVYRITLDSAYNKLLALNLTLVENTASGFQLKGKAHTVTTSTGGTIDVHTVNSGSAADVSAACEIHFSAFLRNSSVV